MAPLLILVDSNRPEDRKSLPLPLKSRDPCVVLNCPKTRVDMNDSVFDYQNSGGVAKYSNAL